jgi:hypothetical protein
MLERLWFVLLVGLAGCGQSALKLQWPATVASIEGIEGSYLASVTNHIEDLNRRLGATQIHIGSGNGSPITIKRVTDFSASVSSTLLSESEFAFVATTGSMKKAANTRIAGRATLSNNRCVIELATFLFDDGQRELLAAVLWHEIGHCGGLAHDSKPGELMSSVTNAFNFYSEAQLTRFFDALNTSIAAK